MTFSVRSVSDDVEGRENESVGGRESPGKEERRTFTFDDVILAIKRRVCDPICLAARL